MAAVSRRRLVALVASRVEGADAVTEIDRNLRHVVGAEILVLVVADQDEGIGLVVLEPFLKEIEAVFHVLVSRPADFVRFLGNLGLARRLDAVPFLVELPIAFPPLVPSRGIDEREGMGRGKAGNNLGHQRSPR